MVAKANAVTTALRTLSEQESCAGRAASGAWPAPSSEPGSSTTSTSPARP